MTLVAECVQSGGVTALGLMSVTNASATVKGCWVIIHRFCCVSGFSLGVFSFLRVVLALVVVCLSPLLLPPPLLCPHFLVGCSRGVSACPLLLWPFCLVPVGPLLPVSADLPLPRVFLPVSLSLIGGITYVCLSCFGMDAVKSR